jgi:hypothetical protein
MRRLLLLCIALVLSSPVAAWGQFTSPTVRTEVILTSIEVATGTPVVAALTNDNYQTAYLFVKTENETATASLVVTVTAFSALGGAVICTMAAITEEKTTVALLGSLADGSQEGITDACDYPLPKRLVFTFTTTGAGADFDVSASVDWIKDG